MTPLELVTYYPRLYHMAAEGTWPSIRERGLMTTRQLVDLCHPDTAKHDAVLCRRRPTNVTLQLPDQTAIVVRDQAPLRENFLKNCLDDMTTQEWLDVLNGRVFFWLHPEKLSTLLNARRYRQHANEVLIVDTASMIRAHSDRIRLSAINSGATLYPNAPKRGPKTFQTISDYPFRERRKVRSVRDTVAELAVVDGVVDVAQHVVRVERRRGDDIVEVLMRSYTGHDSTAGISA